MKIVCALNRADGYITHQSVVGWTGIGCNKDIAHNIVYTPHFIVRGSTSIEFTFDFQIMGKEREIVLRTFNSVSTFNVPQFLFGWEDIKSNREAITQKELMGLAVINDMDKEVGLQYIEALKQRKTEYILWSEKDEKENLQKLAA